MTSIEIKVSLSGAELRALQVLSGTPDDLQKLRSTARTVIKTTLLNMASAMSACAEGRVGDLDIDGAENNIEEQKKL